MQPASSKPPSDFSSDPQYQQFLEWQAQDNSPSHLDETTDPQYRLFHQFQQFTQFLAWQGQQSDQQQAPQHDEQQQQKEQLLQKLQSQLEQLEQQRIPQPAPPQVPPKPRQSKPQPNPYELLLSQSQAQPQATTTKRLPIGCIITIAILALIIGGVLYLIFGLPRANLVVASYQNYSDTNGDLHFIGLLKNIGNGDASNATVNVVLKDSKGRQDGNGDDSLFGSKLGPGQTVGFDISISEPPGDWKSVAFNTTTEDSNLSPATGLQVSNSSIGSDQNGFVITGTVQNNGQNDAKRATIFVTAYDTAGAVVAVATGYSDSRDGINSGQSDSFTANIYRKDIKIARYDTFVYADAK